MDGLDGTTLAEFAVLDASVASIGDGQVWNVVQGVAPGSTRVVLAGRANDASAPQALVTTSDSLVTVNALRSRVITSLAWAQQPDSQYEFGADVVWGALLRSVMTAEGHVGHMFSTVTFSGNVMIRIVRAHLTASDLPSCPLLCPPPSQHQHILANLCPDMFPQTAPRKTWDIRQSRASRRWMS